MSKRILNIIVIGAIIGVLLMLLDVLFRYFSDNTLPAIEVLGKELVIYMLYSIPLSAVNAMFFEKMESRYKTQTNFKIQLLAGFIGSVMLTVFTMFCIRMVHKVVILKYSFERFFETETLRFYFVTVLITLVISLFFHAFYFYKKIQEDRVKKQQIIAGNASAQFESLKNQIDPHFLFNSLNVLTSLIDEQPHVAQRFTNSLSKIYRYVLEQKNKELVSVEEELDFAREYMDLLKIRFENSITYSMPERVSNTEAKVVPLSLQLLLENTIKHNVVSENRPLHIKIYEEGNYLVVENNLQKKEVLQTRKGVGLQNIADRYQLVTDRKVVIEQNDTNFKVKIPQLTKQFTVMETLSSNTENNLDAYYKAQKRVKDIKDFYGNLGAYIIVIPVLIFINLYTNSRFQWFWFPMLGWGIGVAIHAFTVFGYGSDWEARKIKEIMEKEQLRNNKKWD